MRKNIVFGVTALGIAGVFLAGPVADAAGIKGSLGVVGDTVRAGDIVQFIGACNAPGFTTAKVQSTVLAPAEVYLKDDGVGGMGIAGFSKVKKGVKPGTYSVGYKCGSVLVTTKLTVLADGKKTSQVAVKPKGAPATGDGSVGLPGSGS